MRASANQVDVVRSLDFSWVPTRVCAAAMTLHAFRSIFMFFTARPPTDGGWNTFLLSHGAQDLVWRHVQMFSPSN